MSEEITDAQVMREALIQAGQDQFQILMAEYMHDMAVKIQLMDGHINVIMGMVQELIRQVQQSTSKKSYEDMVKDDMYRWYGKEAPQEFLLDPIT